MSLELEKFIPEALRDPTSGILSKTIEVFQRVLQGNFSEIDFEDTLYDLGRYWSAQRPEHVAHLQTLLDPFDLTQLISDDASLNHFFTVLQDLYASKGTDKMFRYILSLCGLEADIIKWYEPEYLKYSNFVERCSAILIVKVKDTGLSDTTAELLDKLVEMLLDVCLVISSLILIKGLEDKVDAFDKALKITINSKSSDSYSRCKFVLSDMYDLKEYRRSDHTCSYETVERFLTPEELIRYSCTGCSYIYDPVSEERVPFLNRVSFICPQCGSSDFIPFEYDPQEGIDLLKLTALILGYLDELKQSFSLDERWVAVETAWKEWEQVFVSYNSLNKETVHDFVYLLTTLERDGYRPLQRLGLTINEARWHSYRRGYITSPYGFHSDPNVVYDIITHEERETCSIYHDGKYRFQSLAVVSDKTDLVTKMVHIKDPVLYHENHLELTHNYEYRRGERFDLTKRLCYSCSDVDSEFYGLEGVYPYPRHLGDHGPREYGWWFWGIYGIYGGIDSELIRIQNEIQKNGFNTGFLQSIRQAAYAISLLTNTQKKNFLTALAEALPFLTDDVYLAKSESQIDSGLQSLGEQILKFFVWVEQWKGDTSTQNNNQAVETKRALTRLSFSPFRGEKAVFLLDVLPELRTHLQNKPYKSYASSIPMTPRICNRDPYQIVERHEQFELFGHFHIRHDSQAAHRWTEYNHNSESGIYETYLNQMTIAFSTEYVAWSEIFRLQETQHAQDIFEVAQAQEFLTRAIQQYCSDRFPTTHWTQLQHNMQIFHVDVDIFRSDLHLESWDTGIPRGSDQFPSPIYHEGVITHGDYKDHTLDRNHLEQYWTLSQFSDPPRPSGGEFFYIRINDGSLGFLHPLSDPVRWETARSKYQIF